MILVSIDTLRSDRLPIYGYRAVDTPAIDALRRDAIFYQHAYTHIGLTLPSHASILSGRLPLELGLRDNVGYRFGEDAPTLAAELARHGYRTAGFVSSYVLRRETGIHRGFEVWDDDIVYQTGKQLGGLQRKGSETLARASAWLEEHHQQHAGDPFFLFFHIYEPHAPYDPEEPWASRYSSPYDAEVAQADAVIGELVALLQRLDLYDRALVILLSDHGEGLMDHGEMDHIVFVYREVLQGPLLVKLPHGRGAGASVATQVQLTDVAPTIYGVLGASPPPDLAGRSLFAGGTAEPAARAIFSESVYPRLHFGRSDLASLIDGNFHYIDAPRPELFDLAADPAEKHNLVGEQTPLVGRLLAHLRGIDRTLEGPLRSDPEVAAELAALGYVSGGAAITQGPLPDPKDKLPVIAELGRATGLSHQGRWREAAAAYREVLAKEPGLVLGWQQLGGALERLRVRPQALAAYERALELSGGATDLALTVAELHYETGDLERARRHAELILEEEPLAYNVLAKIALRQGDLAAAERHVERAIAGRGRRVAPLITKVALLNRLDRNSEALDVASQAQAEFGSRDDEQVLMNLHFQRATVLGKLGRFEEAKRDYRRAIELGPAHLQAYSALAFILALEGKAAEAGQVLRDLVTRNENPSAYAEAVRALRAMKDEASAAAVLAQARRRWPADPELRRP